MPLSVFLFPIYACGIPNPVIRFLRKGTVPARGLSPKPRAAVVCTMGDVIWHDKKGKRHHLPGFEGHALTQAAGILRRRGYGVFVTGACSYPFNWTQAVNAPKPKYQAELLALGDSQATELGRKIAAGERSIRRFHIAHAPWSVPFDVLYRIFGRVGLGKLYVADRDCNGCGECARGCPARAIHLKGTVPMRGQSLKPRWNWSCEGCQRCINTCPKNAIQTSWARLAAETIHALIPIPIVLWLLAWSVKRSAWSIAMAIVVWLGVYAVFTLLLDELVWLLGRIPGIRRLIEANFTKHLRRYLEPHFRP
jgi:ferredoxin